jgi:tRNA 5-methylaminomethyl-2-thiouridine biosynthesis bifunctional protein
MSHANVTFNDNGTPISESFDDIYFSDADGLEETKYVFLHRNGLPERWRNFDNKTFVVAETGFGTGLNFLSTWQSLIDFNASHNHNTKLKFVTFEKFPLLKSDLSQAYKTFPELESLTSALLAQYPESPDQDIHMSFNDGEIELNVLLGDVNQRIAQLPDSIAVNAWYLDGFAPSKNPDMWNQELFNHLARLAAEDCHLATFTAVGFVCRGLIEAGFNMTKYKGFGHKREMIAGSIKTTQES